MRILAADPSSAISAAVRGWDHPISREALIMMDQYDLSHAVAAGGKRVKGHPGRPGVEAQPERVGDAGGRTPAEVRAILEAARRGEFT